MIHWSQHLGLGLLNINKAPQELRQYIEDLAALGVLALEPTGSKSNQSNTTTVLPSTSAAIEYARWLVAAATEFMPTVRLNKSRHLNPLHQLSRMCREHLIFQ